MTAKAPDAGEDKQGVCLTFLNVHNSTLNPLDSRTYNKNFSYYNYIPVDLF
jgi:hypothetical protein